MPSRRTLVLLGVPLALVLLVPLGSRLIVHRIEAEGLGPRLAPDGGERLLADLEWAHEKGFFAGRGAARDAAPVLNALVAGDGEMEGDTPAWWATPDAFADFDAYKSGKKPDWLEVPELTEKYDVSFLAGWREFDHWQWAAADPFRAHFEKNPEQCAFESPIPNYIPFQRLAKVRMAQGYHRGDLAEAMADTEHLAMLAYSTDTLVGAMVGVAILRIEEHALTRAAEAGKEVPARAWSKADLDRLKPAVMASAGVFTAAPDSELARTLGGRGELPGVCAGVAEAAVVASLLRPYIEHPWPGEVDHSGLVTGIEDALARSGCAVPFARRAWERGGVGCLSESSGWERALLATPYLRGPPIATLEVIAAPNFLGPYGVEQ